MSWALGNFIHFIEQTTNGLIEKIINGLIDDENKSCSPTYNTMYTLHERQAAITKDWCTWTEWYRSGCKRFLGWWNATGTSEQKRIFTRMPCEAIRNTMKELSYSDITQNEKKYHKVHYSL